ALSLRDPNVRIAAWDQVAAFNPAVGNEPGGDAYDFLRFSNTVDALLTASRIWPVKIVEGGMGSGQNSEWVAVEALQDEGRDRMALALGLDPPARQLERAFFDEVGEVDGETTFNLVDEPKLLNVVTDGKWVIKRALLTDDGARRYEFQRVGGVAARPEGDVCLRPADVGGSFKLLERRLKAIESLRSQATMLRAIESPGSVSRDTMETL